MAKIRFGPLRCSHLGLFILAKGPPNSVCQLRLLAPALAMRIISLYRLIFSDKLFR